jgi:hypothetical protein
MRADALTQPVARTSQNKLFHPASAGCLNAGGRASYPFLGFLLYPAKDLRTAIGRLIMSIQIFKRTIGRFLAVELLSGVTLGSHQLRRWNCGGGSATSRFWRLRWNG